VSSIPGLTRPHKGHGPLHSFKTKIINQIGPSGLDPLHNPLNRTVAEIVQPRRHHKAINSHHFSACRHDLVGKKIPAGSIGIDTGAKKVSGHLGIGGRQLFGIFGHPRQTPASASRPYLQAL